MKHFNIAKISLYLFNVFLVFLCIFLVFFAISLMTGSPPKAADQTANYEESDQNYRKLNSPNVVTNGLAEATDQFGRNLSATGDQISSTSKYIGETAVKVASSIAKQTANIAITIVKKTASAIFFVVKGTGNIIFIIVKTTASAVNSVLNFIFQANIKTYSFAFSAPVRVVSSVIDKPVITNFVAPSQQITDVPIIDPKSPDIKEAIETLSEEETNQSEVNAALSDPGAPQRVRWPITGNITTLFGVPHWPYQPVHTGLDISDHTLPGVTPVMPFRAGRVIYTHISNSGLGNHVIVDHGSGITSVYAHLDSIAVTEGQVVNTDTELGRQGTTGVSTGTHLHFEIRINGQATNPLPFLNS